jgi:O-antigen ligase
MSLMWTAHRYSTIMWLEVWGLVGLTFRLSTVVAVSKQGRDWILKAYLAVAAVFAVGALGMFVTGGYERLTGTFYWPNPAAAYLLPALMLAMDGVRRARSRRLLVIWFGLLTLFGSAFWLTGSRAAMLVLAFVMVLFCLFYSIKRQVWITILFSILSVLSLSIGLTWLAGALGSHHSVAAPVARFGEVVSGQSQSGRDRFQYVESALEMWFAHPFGGVGAGAYGSVHPAYQATVVSAAADAHNWYIQMLAELGIVGAMMLAALILAWLFGVLRRLVQSPELLPLALGIGALAIHLGLDIDAAYPALLLTLVMLAGVIWRPLAATAWRSVGPVWLVGAVLGLIPAVSVYESTPWVTRAQAAQVDSDYELAVHDYDLALAGLVINPDWLSGRGINELALAEVARGENRDPGAFVRAALVDAHEAQKLDAYDGQHWQLEGRILAEQQHWPEAERAFRQALARDHLNRPDYALDLARVEVQMGRGAAARQIAEAMLTNYPAAVVANRAADETLKPALADLETVVGNLEMVDGNLAAAARAARRSLDLVPGNLRGLALQHQLQERKAW